MTLEFPEFVSVRLRAPLFPTAMFPKFKLEALVVRSDVAAIPVPLNETIVGEFGVLLVTETLPESVPAATGANLTLKLVVAPAASDIGVVSPLIVYPVPEIGAWLIVAAAVPVLESVIVCVPLLPTFTLPKLSDVGLAESCGETPVPVAAIVTGEPVALLVTVTDPFTAPDTVGANTIESTVVCPAVSVIGVVIPF